MIFFFYPIHCFANHRIISYLMSLLKDRVWGWFYQQGKQFLSEITLIIKLMIVPVLQSIFVQQCEVQLNLKIPMLILTAPIKTSLVRACTKPHTEQYLKKYFPFNEMFSQVVCAFTIHKDNKNELTQDCKNTDVLSL